MRKRIFFLVPNVKLCKTLVEELNEVEIHDDDIHVIGNHFTPLEDLHEASFVQKSDFNHGIELGLGVGGAAGLLGGLLAVTFPPAGLVLGGGAVVAAALAGAGAGALVSGLVAKDIPNQKLDAFEDAIAAGQLLMLVDIPTPRLDEITDLVHSHHPEVQISVSRPSNTFEGRTR